MDKICRAVTARVEQQNEFWYKPGVRLKWLTDLFVSKIDFSSLIINVFWYLMQRQCDDDEDK